MENEMDFGLHSGYNDQGRDVRGSVRGLRSKAYIL